MSLESAVASGSVLNRPENMTYKLDKDSIEYIAEFSKFVNLNQGEACSLLYKGLQSSGNIRISQYDAMEETYFVERAININLAIQAINSLESSPNEKLFTELISSQFHNKLKDWIETSFAASLRFSDQLELSGKFNNELNLLCSLYKRSVLAMADNTKGIEVKENMNGALKNTLSLIIKISKIQSNHCNKYRLEDEYANGLITPGQLRLIESLVVIFSRCLEANILDTDIEDQLVTIGAPLKQFILLLMSKSIMLWEKNESHNTRSAIKKLKEVTIEAFETGKFFSVLYTQLTNFHYDGTELMRAVPVIKEGVLNLLKVPGVSKLLKQNILQTREDLFVGSNGYATNSEAEYFMKLIEFIEKHDVGRGKASSSFLLDNQILLVFASFAKSINISNYNINQFSKTVLFAYKKAEKQGKGGKLTMILENSDCINSNNILVTVIEALKLFKNERPNLEEELTLHSVLRLVQCFPELMISDADLIQVIIALLSYDGFSSYIRAELLNILHQMTLLSTERATQIWGFVPQFLAMVFVDYKEVQSKDNNYTLSIAFLRLLKSIVKGRSMMSFFDTIVDFMSLVLNNQHIGSSSDRKLLIETCLFVSDNIFLMLLRQQSLVGEKTVRNIVNQLLKLYTSSISLMNEIEKKVEKRSPLRMASSSTSYLLKLNTYKPLCLIESSVKSLYIVLFNLPNPEDKIHSFTTENKDNITSLLKGFPHYALKLLYLLLRTDPFTVLNQLVLKNNPKNISSILYHNIMREEVLGIITTMFNTLAQVNSRDNLQPVAAAFVDEFTNKDNLALLFEIINDENTKNGIVNLALECLRSMLSLGLKRDLQTFQLCVQSLHSFLIVDEGSENELRISDRINEPVITNKNKLFTDSKKLAVQCFTSVFYTAKNWAHLNAKDLVFMKKIRIRDVLNAYFIAFLEKEKEIPSFELLNELLRVYLEFQKTTKIDIEFDSEITCRVLEALSIFSSNLTEFESLINFIELAKGLLVEKETLVNQTVIISEKSESSHLKKLVYTKISSMLDLEDVASQPTVNKWPAIGDTELISQIIKETNLLLNTIKVEKTISERKNILFLNNTNKETDSGHLEDIISCVKMLNYAVYLTSICNELEEKKLKTILLELHLDVIIKLILSQHNNFTLNTRLLRETETLLSSLSTKIETQASEFLECLLEDKSVYDTIEQIIKRYNKGEDKSLLNKTDCFEVLIPLLKLLISLPTYSTEPCTLFAVMIIELENAYFEALNYLFLFSKGKIKKNERLLNLSLLCVEMAVINNIQQGKLAMKIEHMFMNNREFVERRNIETELGDLIQFVDKLKFQNREINYSKRVVQFVDFITELNRDE